MKTFPWWFCLLLSYMLLDLSGLVARDLADPDTVFGLWANMLHWTEFFSAIAYWIASFVFLIVAAVKFWRGEET